jgi:hypothetical protein
MDPLNPTIDDVKLHVSLMVNGHADIVNAEIDRLAMPALRQYAGLVIDLLADVKTGNA